MSATYQSEQSIRRNARLAGLAYVIYSLAGAYISFGPVPSIRALSDAGTSSPALEHLFRTGFLAEAVMYTFVVVSAAAMYLVLRSVNPGVALIAAFCRLVEGAMGASFILFKYAAFTAVVHPDLMPGFTGAERESLVMLLRDVYSSSIYLLLIPMAFGGVLYFALFFQARFLPRWLSGLAVLTYAVIGTVAGLIVLFPDLREHIMLFFVPGALVEWLVAAWLLLAGINTKHWMKAREDRLEA